MGKPKFNPPRPILRIRVSAKNFPVLLALARTVSAQLLANVATYATPAPPLLTIDGAADDLEAAMAAHGTGSNRGSKTSYLDLVTKAQTLLRFLEAEKSYVENTIDQNTSDPFEAAQLLSLSGFPVKNPRSKIDLNSAVRNLRQVNNKKFAPAEGVVRWAKPIGYFNGERPHAYNVYINGVFHSTVTQGKVTLGSIGKKVVTIRPLTSQGEGLQSAVLVQS